MSGPVTAVARSANRKLGGAAATYLPVEQSCPPTCELRKRCYAQSGHVGLINRRLERAATGLTPVELARAEADAIDALQPSGQPLRHRVSGDHTTPLAARLASAAGERWMQRGGGPAWGYTHAWRDIPRASWGAVSVLASVHSAEDGAAALARGYAPARTVDHLPLRSVVQGGVRWIPCPQQREGSTVTCASCRLCFRGDALAAQRSGILFAAHGDSARHVAAASTPLTAPSE